MNRRSFLGTSAAAGVAATSAAAASSDVSQYTELKFIQMRNSKSNQRGRTTEFLEKHHLPMTKRAGYAAARLTKQEKRSNYKKMHDQADI